MSGRRDSNSRPSPWKGDALPTELLPLGRGWRTRTADLALPKRARYQLRQSPQVGEVGVEPTRWINHHEILSLARLPVPPLAQVAARDGFEPSLTASKTAVLPLDDLALIFERVMGFAPTTFSLATRRSTAELHPLIVPGPGVAPESHVFQTRAVTTLATLADSGR